MIVSEDAAERQRALSALTASEVEIVEAASAREAARMLADAGADVLVVDGDLQPKGGFSWLYEMTGQAALNGVARPPAIVLVSRGQDTWLAKWASAQACVDKPADSFEVARHVRALAG